MVQFKFLSVQIKFMNGKYAALLDNNTLLDYCLGDTKASYSKSNEEFFDFLKLHSQPIIGLVTLRTRYDVRRQLTSKLRYQENKNKCLEKLDRIGDFAKPVSVDHFEFKQNMREVTDFFNDFTNQGRNNHINLNQVCRRFQNVIKSAYNFYPEKTFLQRPEREDRELLAEALCLSSKYNPLWLVSNDEHFSGNKTSDAIGKAFGIVTGYPKVILPLIKDYEKALIRKN